MGDRANIKVTSKWGGEIHFYTHWDGYKLLRTLQDALKRGEDRWGDDIYLNRIIFCEMIKDDVLGTTGFGISVPVGDGDNRIIVVDHDKMIVTYKNDSWTFKDFIQIENVPEI